MPAQQVLRTFFASFYPSNGFVVDKNRLFYPLQRIYWIKISIFAIANEKPYNERI